jgi:hypothetical protein
VIATLLSASLSACSTARTQGSPPPTAERAKVEVEPAGESDRVGKVGKPDRQILMAIVVMADNPARKVYVEDFLSAFSKQSGFPNEDLRGVKFFKTTKLTTKGAMTLALFSPLLLAGAAIEVPFFLFTLPAALGDAIHPTPEWPSTSSTSRVVLCPGRTRDQVLADAQKAAIAIGFDYVKTEHEELWFSRIHDGAEEARLSVSAFEASSESFE